MRTETQFNVLLIEPDAELAGTIAFALQSEFGASVVECADVTQASIFLKQISEVDLVIFSDKVNDYSLFSQSGGGGSLKAIVCVLDKLSDPSLLLYPGVIGIARRNTLIDDILSLVRKDFFRGEAVTGLQPSDFCQLNPRLLLKVFPLSADVYIRLSGEKYLKLFNKGSAFELSDFEKFSVQKRVQHFYVKRSESRSLLDSLRREVQTVLDREPMDSEVVGNLIVDIQESVHDLVLNVGVTEEVREMTTENVKLVLRSLKEDPKLKNVLTRFQVEKELYIPQHSLALAEIACGFAGIMEWVSDLTFQKLILASLFHDISLSNNEMARYRTLAEIESQNWLTEDNVKDIKSHPVKGADLVAELGEVPTDVTVIIRQHHERPNGTGFPQGINHTKFTPLSCLFLMAHDFLDFYLQLEKDQMADALPMFIKEYEQEYSAGLFKQTLRELANRTK